MTEDQREEALESIRLIKDLVIESKKEIRMAGGGWIAIIWGLFCYVGLIGQRLLIPQGPLMGVWWLGLSLIALTATFLLVKHQTKSQPAKPRYPYMRYMAVFWIPLIILAYTLCMFCVFLPELSRDYIPIFILLVISTGYVMLGFMFVKEILVIGIVGFISTILTAIFFLEYSDIILNLLFGTGLIIFGILANRKWQEL
jgi:hypothetical protein